MPEMSAPVVASAVMDEVSRFGIVELEDFPPDLRELIVVATLGTNHCTYCIVARGAILRIRARAPQLPTMLPAILGRPS